MCAYLCVAIIFFSEKKNRKSLGLLNLNQTWNWIGFRSRFGLQALTINLIPFLELIFNSLRFYFQVSNIRHLHSKLENLAHLRSTGFCMQINWSMYYIRETPPFISMRFFCIRLPMICLLPVPLSSPTSTTTTTTAMAVCVHDSRGGNAICMQN